MTSVAVELAGRELELKSQRIEDMCAELIVRSLPASERRHVAARLAHRFGWEVADNDLYAAARELGIDLDRPAGAGTPEVQA